MKVLAAALAAALAAVAVLAGCTYPQIIVLRHPDTGQAVQCVQDRTYIGWPDLAESCARQYEGLGFRRH